MPLPMMEPTTRPRPKVPGLRLLDVDGAIAGCAGGLYEVVVMLFCLSVGDNLNVHFVGTTGCSLDHLVPPCAGIFL